MEISEKQHNRDSIVTHLKMLQSMGVTDFFKAIPVGAGPAPSRGGRSAFEGLPRPSEKTSTTEINTLEDLRTVIGDCQRCKLCSGRKNIVFGVGNPKAELMFVGEGPGADEDEKGEPFVGRAGQLLTKMINAMGFERSDIYIANVVKCRPPENRNPEPDEITACMPFLMQQIAIIKPKVIMCLGKFAAQTVLKTEITISRLRGHFQDVNGVAVMPTFHPAYLLRNPGMKKIAWEDCKLVMEKLGKTGNRRAP